MRYKTTQINRFELEMQQQQQQQNHKKETKIMKWENFISKITIYLRD